MSNELIAQKDFLQKLRGQQIHLSSPRNHFVIPKVVCINKDNPIVATGKSSIKYTRRGQTTDATEIEMMTFSWNVFNFFDQTPQQKQEVIAFSGKCFSHPTFTTGL